MNKTIMNLMLISSLVLAFAACAPKPAPAPSTPAPTTPQAAPPTPVPTPSAWDKVVAEAKKEGQTTLYSFGFTGDIGRAVSDGFRKASGIRVDFVTGIGTVLMERIKTEHRAGRFIADTYDTSAVFVAQAKGDGLTVSAGDLPVYEEKVWKVHPRMDKEGHILGQGVATTTLYINTTLVKPGEEPKSYKDLLDPRWKGKLLFPSPITQPNCVSAYVAYKKNGVLDDAYWAQLSKQDFKVSPTIRDHDSMLVRGEASVGICSVDITINPFIKEGAPAKPIVVSEGPVTLMAPAIAMVKNGPHPNATRLFLNWFFTQEGQRAYHQARATTSPRSDLPTFAPPAGRMVLDKFWVSDMNTELEAARLQREGSFTKLMGLETK